MHVFTIWIVSENLRHFGRIFAVRSHPPGQCFHSTQNQPAIEGRGHRAGRRLNRADSLKKFVVPFCDNDSAEHIAVAAKIFGGGMEYEIGADFEWPLNDARPGIMTNGYSTGSVRDLALRRRTD